MAVGLSFSRSHSTVYVMESNVKTWNKTRIQGLLRHKSGAYYARIFAGGKEKWLSLKTNLFEVAKAQMKSDKTIAETRHANTVNAQVKMGKATVSTLINLYKAELSERINLKESTRRFWLLNLESIVKSWPELQEIDARKVTEADCRKWAAKNAPLLSASYFNNSIITLTRIFDVAMKEGLIYRNPAKVLERKREKKKDLKLPSREQFLAFVKIIRSANHRTSTDAGDLVELLAYTGCRISEATRLEWSDVNFEKGEILIKGDPLTGTKNWGIRHVPLLPDCTALLNRMKEKRIETEQNCMICKVGDISASMKKASTELGIEKLTHHDLRHLFATICIESGVDIPTVSRWLGHKDGGALAMRTYGHLRREHSLAQAQKVKF